MPQEEVAIQDIMDTFSYKRTLDREAVNRWAVSEVLLTDFYPLDREKWVVGAQLPSSHIYYGDHVARSETYDLLMVLEACRQAATYGGYIQFGNPLETVNIANYFEIKMSSREYIPLRSQPAEIAIRVVTTDVIEKGGRVRGTTPVMEIFRNGRKLGDATIRASFVTPDQFHALRVRQRGSEPPKTTRLADAPLAELDFASTVGRNNPVNVVISHARIEDNDAVAELALSGRNRSLLDHEYDHVPAMALIEAARQLGLLLLQAPSGDGPGCAVDRLKAVSVAASFDRFAEVDGPTILKAHRLNEKTDSDTAFVETEFIQAGNSLTRVKVGYAYSN